MPKRKLVIDEKEGSVLMGVMKEGADPVIKTVEGTLENALTAIPKLIEEAEAKWATSLKNPAYKAPPEPKKAPAEPKVKDKAAAEKPAAGKTAEELPLLAGTEAATTEEKAEAVAEDKAPQVEVVVTPAPEQPVAIVVAGEKKTAMSKMAEQAPAATPTAPSGEWQYWLEDGRGPFSTVQEAMDAKGLDKATRPQHNRWDRLSTELKKAILRKPKV